MKKIIFRCDSSENLGTGHVMRCIALAEIFGSHGWEILFSGCYEYPLWIKAYLQKNKYIKIVNVSDISNIKKTDVIVVDSYSFDKKSYENIFNNAKLRVSIVDPINIGHDADLYFSNTPQKYFKNFFSQKNSFFGLEYSLIRKSLLNQKNITHFSGVSPKIILFTGGTFRPAIIDYFLRVIDQSNFEGDVLVFGTRPNYLATHKKLQLEFRDFSPNYPKFIKSNDYIFCPASSISLELLTLQYQIFIYKFTDNQEALYDVIVDKKLAQGLGVIEPNYINDHIRLFNQIISNPIHVPNLNQKRDLDGLGSSRIFGIISNHPLILK